MDSLPPKSRPGITAENWAELKALFDQALELSEADRLALLATCSPCLRSNFAELLRWHAEQVSDPTHPLLSQTRILEYFQAGVRTFRISDLVCGRFRIERFLGEGGMGEVYAASDLELGGTVAIKTLRPSISGDSQMLAYFRQEIHLARKVTHPNVCRTFDIFQHQVGDGKNILVLSMEYLEGRTLLDRVRQEGRLEPKVAWPIIDQVAQGLAAAHKSGIVHRDLKSSNIILVPQADAAIRAVVTDFGLAQDQLNSIDVLANNDQEVAGTPAYMAPEQLARLPVTPLVDIYAFGVVLYEMLTGRLPFEGDTGTEVARQRLGGIPASPRQFVPTLSAAWANTILACLEKDPAKRPQSVEEVCGALSEKRVITRRSLLAGLVVAIVSSGVYVRIILKKEKQPPYQVQVSLKRAQEFARRRTQENLQNAVTEFQDALRQDPMSVEGWTGLADAYSAMANFHFMDTQKGYKAAQDAAYHALKLDPSSGRARGVLAYCESNDLSEWLQAEPQFKEAIRLAPSDPEVRLWFGAYLGKLGRVTEAIQQLKVGLQEDPTSPALNLQLATEYFLSGQNQDLNRQALELIRLQPFEAASHLMLARSFEQQGRYGEALQSCQKAEQYHYSTTALCLRGSIEAAQGRTKTARAIAAEVEQYWKTNYFESLLLAALYGRLNEASRAIDILLAGCDRNDSSVLWAPQHPHLAAIRQDPRYAVFLTRIGLKS
jgi:serine/threonine protein kinase